MTTIAWDGLMLAADKQASVADSIAIAPVKIRRLNDGTLIGCAGNSMLCEMIIKWVAEKGERPAILSDKEEWCPAIEVTPEGKVFFHGQYGRNEIIVPFFAIGSGGHFAMGAMGFGANAAQAVEVASRLDPFSGCGIDCLALGGSQ